MKKVISSEKVPIKMWLDDCEEGAIEQAKNLANLPYVFKHVSMMADSHQGYFVPIGGVLATKDVIVPHAVGKDSSCGVVACKTSLKIFNQEDIKSVMSKVRELIPVGFNHHTSNQSWEGFNRAPDIKIIQDNLESAKKQLGTLGSIITFGIY